MSITFECMNGFSKFKISQKAEKISCEISMLPASGARALAHFLTLWAPLIIDAKISKQDCDNCKSLTNVSTNMCTFVLKETISYYKTSILPVSAWLISINIIITREIRNSQVFQPSMYD